MNEWLIALVGAGAALLGVSLQFIFSQITEGKNKIQEVRKNRIDSVEILMKTLFKEYWELLEICEEAAKEKPDTELTNKLSEDMSKIVNQDNLELRLLEAWLV